MHCCSTQFIQNMLKAMRRLGTATVPCLQIFRKTSRCSGVRRCPSRMQPSEVLGHLRIVQ
eukprot:364965-Chlamydomonas_euryale.AAC.13